MKIKVVVHTGTAEGSHVPGDIVDIRESDARLWMQKGWAVPLPVEPKREEPKPPPEEPVDEEEDGDDDEEFETAMQGGAPENALSRRGRKAKKK